MKTESHGPLAATLSAVVLIGFLPIIPGCGSGAPLQPDGAPSGGGSSGAAAGGNGTETGICHGGCLCVRSLEDCPPGCYATAAACLNGPSPDGTSVRVPLIHRRSGSRCPAQRAPGSICNSGVQMPGECTA